LSAWQIISSAAAKNAKKFNIRVLVVMSILFKTAAYPTCYSETIEQQINEGEKPCAKSLC
jgi:hypothetical protein